MLVVLDAGVLVSAAITPGGVPSRVVAAAVVGRYELLLCPMLIEELTDVLARPKFAPLVGEVDRARFLSAVVAVSHSVGDPAKIAALSRDPDDDYLLALAVEHRADWIVTGDRDLLALTSPPASGDAPRLSRSARGDNRNLAPHDGPPIVPLAVASLPGRTPQDTASVLEQAPELNLFNPA